MLGLKGRRISVVCCAYKICGHEVESGDDTAGIGVWVEKRRALVRSMSGTSWRLELSLTDS